MASAQGSAGDDVIPIVADGGFVLVHSPNVYVDLLKLQAGS
ncbi:MAG: hypothetical protein AAF483_07045 [Planctomycetota bacterium]